MALGLTVVMGGALGIADGAYLSDQIARQWAWARALIISIGLALGTPTIFVALHSTQRLPFLLFFGLSTLFMSWSHAPLPVTIHDLAPPSSHSTALGWYYLFVNLSAMALAPLIIDRGVSLWLDQGLTYPHRFAVDWGSVF